MVTESIPTRARGVEERRCRRRSAPLRCWLSDGLVERYASLADISTDGARIGTVSPPALGSTVMLRFCLRTGGEEIHAVARVVWRAEGFRGRGGVVGVHFTNIVGAEAIAAFVEEG
jgi:hypothetical protein